jgi:vacuolar-type H+-ATPase subunit I/STV1
MKKEALSKTGNSGNDNAFGIASVVLGIFSIVFASINGIILGIIGLIFAIKQQNKTPTSWGKAGEILAIIGIVLSILAIIVSAFFLNDLFGSFGGYANA